MAEVMEQAPFHVLGAELKEKIIASDRCIRRAWMNVRKMSLEIGWEGSFIEKNNGWDMLGFKHQHDYRITVGIGKSNWYRLLAIAERFQNLDKEVFLSMSIENADKLSRQPEAIRYDSKNIEAAAKMSMRDFADTLSTQEEHRNGKSTDDKWVDVTWRMKEEQRVVIEKGIEEWRAEHGIDNNAYALELLVSEFRERPTLVGFLYSAIPELTQAVVSAQDLISLQEVVTKHIQAMNEILTTCVGEVEAG